MNQFIGLKITCIFALMLKRIFGIFCLLALLFIPKNSQSWGFWAHKTINRIAVFTLPMDMIGFYKANIDFITEHAIDPDKRRYADPDEAPRHYLDIDKYGKYPYDNLPRKWKEAIVKYSEDTLKAHGIVPWHIEKMYYRLVNAFKDQDKNRILRNSADLGHYIADAHVPLHATSNYNGQFSNQVGIHGLLESRLPELFNAEYDFFVGKARLINSPLQEGWKAILKSASLVDTVLRLELEASKKVTSDMKYTMEQKGPQMMKVYSPEFAREYHTLLSGLVERRMREAIFTVGSFWFSAWVEAGKPDLDKLVVRNLSPEEAAILAKEEKAYQEGKLIGRSEAE